MTQRNRECKVQAQASRVSARIAALTVLALALALTQPPVTPSDHAARSGPAADDSEPRAGWRALPRKGTLGGSNRLLSSRDVAAILAIPERTVRDRWKEWGLPAYRIGKHLRWKERDVYAWIERQSVLPTGWPVPVTPCTG
jgi:excisionase family DNA binding protein